MANVLKQVTEFNGSTSTQSPPPRSGYDLPLYGLDNGQFLLLHIPALVCTFLSFACALTVIVVCFRQNGVNSFFSWNKGERLVIYLELCDAGFNFSTAASRLYIVTTLDHVRPPELCVTYGFILIVTLVSQALMVNVIAVNAFFLMHQGHDMNFGKYDSRILAYTVGLPLALAVFMASSDQLGPSGIVCSGDAVHSKLGSFITSAILILVFFSNIVLYIITWTKINRQAKELRARLSTKSTSEKAVFKAAKTMSMFVAVFFVQWLPTVVYAIWKVTGHQPPILVMKFLASVTNLGGILNGGVYVIIRWEKLKPKKINEEVPMLKVSSSLNKNSVSESGKLHTKQNVAGISNDANTDSGVSDMKV